LLPLAFEEDEGTGDITSLATLDEDASGRARIVCKQAGIVAGLPLVEEVFRFRGIPVSINMPPVEGRAASPGTVLMTLEGPLRGLMVCERILLNFLQRLSGIATQTGVYARILEGTSTRLLDTRKTLPGYRALDKYAVAVGGGANHRTGLYDMVLIKDNHADGCGSVRAAVDRVAARYGGKYQVEAEVRTLAELETLLDAPVDIVMLDNMDDLALKNAIAVARARAPRLKLEASGNMNPDRIARIRDFGLDFISVGSLTHSVGALDISMAIVGDKPA